MVVCGLLSVGKTAILEQLLYGNHTIGKIFFSSFSVGSGNSLGSLVGRDGLEMGEVLSRGAWRVGEVDRDGRGMLGQGENVSILSTFKIAHTYSVRTGVITGKTMLSVGPSGLFIS